MGDRIFGLATRVVRSVSDITVGSVIVLVHVALADRERETRRKREDHARN